MRRLLDDRGKNALLDAVRAIEAESSAEIVLAVRPCSGSYLHADLLMGIASALGTVGVLLYSPWVFELRWFLIDPVLVGTAAGLLGSCSSTLRRWLTAPGVRARRVIDGARAAFVERSVHATRGRTGILIYVSLLERAVAVVPDIGADMALQEPGWREAVGSVERAVARGGSGEDVAQALRGLGALLGPLFPRVADDVNELPDEVAH